MESSRRSPSCVERSRTKSSRAPPEELAQVSAELEPHIKEEFRAADAAEILPNTDHLLYPRNPLEIAWNRIRLEGSSVGVSISLEQKCLFPVNLSKIENAFAKTTRHHPDALLIETNSLSTGNRKRLLNFALDHCLPTVCGLHILLDAGALISYSPNCRIIFIVSLFSLTR
jgi:hypothetical protein